jgi:predicted enzyme related to lactoylglutathione lyase/GNAT superfamily N-acetyltransferase
MVQSASPVLAAADVAETIRFYKEVLGCTTTWMYGEPPEFAGAQWGSVTIMFCRQPELATLVEGHQVWINVEDVDAVHAEHCRNGAQVVGPIEDKPWGRREYTVRDPNGYHLRFVGLPGYVPVGQKEFPEGVTIDKRLPSPQEHRLLSGNEFYPNIDLTGLVESAWGGVVAISPSGEALGMVRIMNDGPGWFSIWDVVVHPDWQGNRIGTKMMEAAIEMIREASPGAQVFLFTYKGGFYERIGFGRGFVHMLKV